LPDALPIYAVHLVARHREHGEAEVDDDAVGPLGQDLAAQTGAAFEFEGADGGRGRRGGDEEGETGGDQAVHGEEAGASGARRVVQSARARVMVLARTSGERACLGSSPMPRAGFTWASMQRPSAP